ncbi:MAG: hypothetical protein A3J27_14320 [Candidatus Tectomicrobia bacterium RIFCSPLOWO2_12_FULL_69_37]|nr:MAG: hypothetical protein A3I72_14310 [Candidatus Tectomicrobia bacterium RIFCSPLOWO2_02_FULL_70_19]OGL62738.1 MAG: hypothetical protein A3J27_14320 [Candidatus Tectomicrobia bacterium RIFCSPLOWO2_12_FULL_69_37]
MKMSSAKTSSSGRVIEREVRRFEAFADSFRNFRAHFDNERIFIEEPSDDSRGAVAGHLADGRYLLHAFKYQFGKKMCERAAFQLLELFGSHLPVRKRDLAHIRMVFSSGRLDAREFVTTVFRNRGDRFLDIVREHGMEEDLATFWGVYLARLFRVRAARHLREDIDFFDWRDWRKGFCPICGHWPAMAHVDPGETSRTLWCLNCGTLWPLQRHQCSCCLNEDRRRLDLLGPVDEPSLRVQVCHDCREYLKEVCSAVHVDKFPFDAYFLGSHSLDLFARGQGFTHESALAVESDNTSSEAHLLTHRMRLPWDH